MKIIFNGRVYNLVFGKNESIFSKIGLFFLRNSIVDFNCSLVINNKEKYGPFYMRN